MELVDLSKPDFSKASIKLIIDLDTVGRSLLTQGIKREMGIR